VDASLDTLLAHRAWVRSLAAALVQPADADDLEQEAWLAALERPPSDEAPRAWLATVLRRTASKMRRTLFRRATRERAASQSEATAATADLVARAETHERVVRAVLALSEPYRSTILLRFFEGLSPTEIARRTATPIDTVKARLRRGLARLRSDLPEDRAWSAALLALALPRRPLALGTLAMTLKTKLAIIATAVLVSGSFLTYRALDRAPATARSIPAHDALASADASAVPGTADAEAPEAPSLPAEPEKREFLVKGVVRGVNGPVHTDARMLRPLEPYAIGLVDGERRLWPPIESKGDAHGGFAVRFPFLGAQGPCEIEFGVMASGFVRQAQRLVVEPGGEYRADFVVEPGVGIAGPVTDPDGRPVAGLLILAVASKTPPYGLATASLLDTDRLLVASEHFARGETDAAGRFEISGLVPGTYGLFTLSPDWILEHEPLEAPSRDSRIVATRAHAITGIIRDARTGKGVATASVLVTVRTPSGWGCLKAAAVQDGALWVVWKPQAREIDEGFDATVRVEAKGYHAAERVLAFPRGTRRVPADLALDPVEAEKLALLRIEVTDTRGRMVEQELSCVLSAADDPARHPTATEFRAVAPGIFELRAPKGSWSVRLGPRRGMGEPLAWSGVLELGRDDVVRCTLPAFGIVRLRRAGAGSWIATAETLDGNRSYSWQVETEEIRLAAAPGEWKVGRSDDEPRTIVVLDGAETVVELE
jgi:RNA polymerase sigma factor (sigma-70 family)